MAEEDCGNSANLTRIQTFNTPKTDIIMKKKVLDPLQARTWHLWSAKPKLYHRFDTGIQYFVQYQCLCEALILRNSLL